MIEWISYEINTECIFNELTILCLYSPGIESIPNYGIGTMTIGSTFIVR